MNITLAKMLKRTAQGRAILAKLSKLSGADEYPELLGRFMPGLTKTVKKVGKYTSKVTGAIAKTAAAAIGIPPSAIDALAKADPTAHKALVQNLATKPAPAAATTMKKGFKIDPKILAIGGASVLAIIILTTRKK